MALSILDFYDITIDPRYKPYFQEERSQGKLEGKLELSYSIAEKMLIQGTSTNSQIAELTELSLQEVQFIQKRLSDAGSLAKN